VATIVAVPAATPVTNPLADTIATAGCEVAHTTAGFATAAPYASVTATANWTWAPTAIAADAGVTTTP
jgi:hypothetical protein